MRRSTLRVIRVFSAVSSFNFSCASAMLIAINPRPANSGPSATSAARLASTQQRLCAAENATPGYRASTRLWYHSVMKYTFQQVNQRPAAVSAQYTSNGSANVWKWSPVSTITRLLRPVNIEPSPTVA